MPSDQTVWLIEMLQSDPPKWWNPDKGWVQDANEAVWFVRKRDAADYLRGTRFPAVAKPTEHVFVTTGASDAD